jgi:hypothetical protein
MSTIRNSVVLRDGWAKIGQLSYVPHLEPAIGATRLAGARVNASPTKASVLRPIDVVSVLTRSEETPRHSTRPYPQPMRLLVSFSPHRWRVRKDSQKQADGGVQNRCAGRISDSIPRCDFMLCAPELVPKVCCAVTADVLRTPTTPPRSVPGSVHIAVDGSDRPPAVVHGAGCLSRICAMFDFNGRSKVVQISTTMDVVSAMLTDISVPVHID